VTPRPLILATLEGYSVEGGFDRPYEPATCFSPSISLGRLAGPGEGDALWTEYERVLEVAAGTGLDGVRLGVEWARVEAHRGAFDEPVLERYANVIRHAKSLGLKVTVATIGAAWPAWLGLEAWLLPWVEPDAVRYVRHVVSYLGNDLDGVMVFADPKGIVERGFLDGTAPPWRRGARDDAASALEQVGRIASVLGDDPLVGPYVRMNTRTIDLDANALEGALGSDVEEIHVRALVKGKGPTSAKNGLLVKHGGAWGVAPEPEFLALLG
jgi:hypothetical protein